MRISDDRLFSYLFGPRFNWRQFAPDAYAQALFGGALPLEWFELSKHKGSFRNGLRAGLDVSIIDHVAMKPAQVEYAYARIDNNSVFGDCQNDLRYSARLVFR